MLGSKIILRERNSKAPVRIRKLTPISQRRPGSKSKVLYTKYFCRPHQKHLLIARKVSDARLVLAIDAPDSPNEDLDLPERSRIVKLANSVTYDRWIRPAFAWKVG